jgi:hypothetical protein
MAYQRWEGSYAVVAAVVVAVAVVVVAGVAVVGFRDLGFCWYLHLLSW